jgi:hypothetical protein
MYKLGGNPLQAKLTHKAIRDSCYAVANFSNGKLGCCYPFSKFGKCLCSTTILLAVFFPLAASTTSKSYSMASLINTMIMTVDVPTNTHNPRIKDWST